MDSYSDLAESESIFVYVKDDEKQLIKSLNE